MPGRYTTGSTLGITQQQLLYIDAITRGLTVEDAAKLVFRCYDDNGEIDKKKLKKAVSTCRGWEDDPNVRAAYAKVMKSKTMPMESKALNVLNAQMDSTNPWIANKAANDTLRYTAQLTQTDEKTITVKVEGMPEIGVPDGNA